MLEWGTAKSTSSSCVLVSLPPPRWLGMIGDTPDCRPAAGAVLAPPAAGHRPPDTLLVVVHCDNDRTPGTPRATLGSRARARWRRCALQVLALAVASLDRTRTSGGCGSCGWGIAERLNSAIAPGRNTRQCVDPPNWKKPSSSPLPT